MNQIKIAQARKNRLAKQQANKEKTEAKKLEAVFELQNKTIQALHDNLEKSYTELKESIDNITIPEYEQKFTDINNTLVKLIGKLEAGINVNNLKDIKQQGDVTVKNLKDITNKVSVTNLKDIKLDTKGLVKDKTLSELDTTLANIANQLGQLDEKLEPKQKPENFMPIRRVIKVGNHLEFDDSSWGGGARGGAGSSGGSTIVSNFPSEYPLPAAQVTTLTPPAAITGYATSAKQDTLIANTGASTPFVNLSADIGVDTIKASAGVLNSIQAVNTNSVDCIVVFYDIAGSVTVGVSTISYILFVPKGDGTNYGASSIEFPNPLNFANAIKYATVTTAFADPATDLVVIGSYT